MQLKGERIGGIVETDELVFKSFAVDTENMMMSGTIAIRDVSGNVCPLFGDVTATLPTSRERTLQLSAAATRQWMPAAVR